MNKPLEFYVVEFFLILVVYVNKLKQTASNIWKIYFGKENLLHYFIHWLFYIFLVSLVPAIIRIAVYCFSVSPKISWVSMGDIAICALTLSALTFQNLSLVELDPHKNADLIRLPKYIDCIQVLTGSIIILSAGLLFYQFLIDNEYMVDGSINPEAHNIIVLIIFYLSIPLSFLSGLFQRNFSK